MPEVLYDINIVVDICVDRQPYASEALRIEELCRTRGYTIGLYAGSVQTMQYTLASELRRLGDSNNASTHSFSEYLHRAAAVLSAFAAGKRWVAALAEDGDVYEFDDPEDEQLCRALRRMRAGAVLLTRDAALIEREENALSPRDFLARYGNRAQPDSPAFVDLHRQLDELRPEIERAIWTTVESTKFINGPDIGKFEGELAEFTGVQHAIGCSSGTDALILGLMALGVRRGDEVIVPDFSFIATAETVALLGAIPVFADIRPDTFNIDPASIEAAVTGRTVGVIPVSLYGQPADMDEVNTIADKHALWVMEDGAQSCGATYKGRRSGSLSRVAATSFFPAKPLGCYGDGGAVFTNDDALAKCIRTLLNHGQRKRYDHTTVGLNARLDTLQAAVLRVKLVAFDEEIERRQQVAEWYTEALSAADGGVQTPIVLDHNGSTWAQYTLRVSDRATLQTKLKDKGIATSIHYPIPLSRQVAFCAYADNGPGTPNSVRAAEEVISLPMHPYLSKSQVEQISEAVVHG